MSRFVLVLVVLALSLGAGCSVWNRPDRRLLDAGAEPDAPGLDAGPDADLDGGIDDGGVDAPDAGPPRTETRCSDGRDDDGDGFVDCLDINDCSADPTCCSDGATTLDERWASVGLPGWSRLPSGGDGPNAPTVSGAPLSSFSSSNTTFARGIIRDPAGSATGCVVIDPGVRIETSLRLMPDATASCTGCAEEAALILTTVQPPVAVASYMNGDRLLADVAVRMRRVPGASTTGVVEVLVAGRVIGSYGTDVVVGDVITVELQLAPGVTEDGTAMSFLDATAIDTGIRHPMAEGYPALLRSELLGPESGCSAGRGLYLAVEGVGNRVGVGALEIAERFCPNPNAFRPVGTPVDATTLSAGAWTAGGVGAPSLYYLDEMIGPGDMPRWDVLFDASDRNRANETLATLRFAVGGAVVNDDAFTLVTPRRLGAPLVAEAFPVCGTGCTDSDREPDFWMRTQPGTREPMDSAGHLVWARRHADGSSEIRHDLLQLNPDARTALGSDTMLLSTATGPAAGMCAGLRSPALAPRPDGQLWLFFVCERPGGPVVLHAELNPTTGALGSFYPEPLLGPEPGTFASLGVFDVDVETWISGDGAETRTLVRAWFVARDGRGPSIGLAEGVGEGMAPTLSELRMFPGNPVLAADDDPLPACADTCRVTSIAASRVDAMTGGVRYLVAFTEESTGAARHLLVPLSQTLPAP